MAGGSAQEPVELHPDNPTETDAANTGPKENLAIEVERQSMKKLHGLKKYELRTLRVKIQQMVPHRHQRPLNKSHAANLCNRYIQDGILRAAGFNLMAGVIPGVDSPDQLPEDFEDLPEGMVVELTSGQHRAEGLTDYVAKTGRVEEGYWYVTIFSYGECCIPTLEFIFSIDITAVEMSNDAAILSRHMDQFNISHTPLQPSIPYKFFRYVTSTDAEDLEVVKGLIKNQQLVTSFEVLKSQPELLNLISKLLQDYPAFQSTVTASFFTEIVKYRLFTVKFFLSTSSCFRII